MRIEDLLSRLIQIQSVNPPGGEIEVARHLKIIFDEYNIPNEIIEPSPGRGSFIAYLGEGEKSLLYLSHIDVVPASEGWSFDPFSGEVKDGFVYGRGALDCKGLVAAEAYAMLQLAKDTNLKGRLIFAATADEETGGNLGVKYLIENHLDKIKTDFVINEGGLAPLRIGSKTCHFTQVGEKGVCWIKLKTSGSSAHGSVPMLGENAVVKMAEVIKGLSEYKPELILIPEVKQLVQAIASFQGFNKDVNEGNVEEAIHTLDDRIFTGSLTAFTRMTVSPNTVNGGIKTNIVPDSCEAELDIRLLPGQDKEYIIKELGPIVGNLDMEIIQYHAPTFSTSDSDFYRLVEETMKEGLGENVILPCISSGASDSRYLRESGIPCYGIGMMVLNLDDKMKQSVHGKDEKIDIDSLEMQSDFLTRLAKKYLEN